MKILSLISVVVIALLPFNANTTNYQFIATDTSIETKICVHAGSNNKLELKNALRQSTRGTAIVNKKFSVNNITCNDMVMAHFAHKYDALDTFAYLNVLTNKKDRIYPTSVEIKDIAAVLNSKNEETIIIYVGSVK